MLEGAASDATVHAGGQLEGRLGGAMTSALDVYLQRVLAGLQRQLRARLVATWAGADDVPAGVGNPGLVVTEADWVAAVGTAEVASVLSWGYDLVGAAVEASEVPAGMAILEADVGAAATAHVQSIRSWGPLFRQEVAQVVTRGVVDGLSSKDIGAQLEQHVHGVDGRRGLVIARTEANAAQNAGRTAVHDSTGAMYWRSWAATPDARVRLSHGEAHGQVRAKGQPFAIGGWLADYPGDTNLPAGERVHCRCAALVSYEPWAASDVAADQRAWRQRVRETAADDGLPIGPDLARLLS